MVVLLQKGASKEDIEKVNKLLNKLPGRKTLDAKRFCGLISLDKDPLDIQRQLRNEWE
ncbi:hypothetical protein [Desertivirga arenae]|uniref:hypothetical protein n=1 Tax=Desertivirga arenae TaxID=2810309 RepID=UPI001A963E02|nr:hypothetical protein [Pedobacter sp. SYSU D00823]